MTGLVAAAVVTPPPVITTTDTSIVAEASAAAAAAPLANASTLPTDAVHVDNHGTSRHVLNSIPRSKRPQPISAASAPSLSLSALAAGLELTPPNSPLRPQITRALPSADVVGVTAKTLSMEDAEKPELMGVEAAKVEAAIPAHVEEEQQLMWKNTVPRPYPKTYQLLGSAASGFEEYGRGAWSTVYCAIETRDPSFAAPLTPPRSPPSSSPSCPIGLPGIHGLLAIKRPSRRDAHRILDEEARILTYLNPSPTFRTIWSRSTDMTNQRTVLSSQPSR